MNNAEIFLTDYASYNHGRQFQFGHWLKLDQFANADELQKYISKHLAEADAQSPLPGGETREEPMITDFEGFPEQLYGESMGPADWAKLWKYFDLLKRHGLENFDNEGDNLLSLWSEYCIETGRSDDEIFPFDDETLQMMFGNDPMKAFLAGARAKINWSDNYLYFDGYGNIHSTDNPSHRIDETELLDWLLDD